jgi:hypothetical protein
MLPKNRIPTHPGEILLEEFLKPLGVSQVALAAHLGIPVQRVNELVRGKRGVTPETVGFLPVPWGARLSSGSICRRTMTLCATVPRRRSASSPPPDSHGKHRRFAQDRPAETPSSTALIRI